ncbi:MAG: hypothetical protein LIP10_14955 [Clostridiales bacterium]|nr:hypothetical protein [Clostridiales bacterium]
MLKKSSYIALLLLAVIISAIAFIIPTDKTMTFWISYIFLMIAFVAQIVIWNISFNNRNTKTSIFLNLPITIVGAIYLVIQIIAFVIFTAIPSIPVWITFVVCIIIVGILGICMISVKAGTNEIEHVESRVQQKVSFIQDSQCKIELLMEKENDDETRAQLQQLAEKIRFSDPMSNDALVEIERAICQKIDELKNASDKNTVIQELNLLLSERNMKCKSSK